MPGRSDPITNTVLLTWVLQTLLLLIVFNTRTTTIVTQQWQLTTTLLSDQTTNHHFKVFVKCWSSVSVTCVPCPQTSTLQQLGLWDHNYHALWKMSIEVNPRTRYFSLRTVRVFQGVLGTRFGSLESEKIIIGSLESEKSGPYRSIPGT